ncbi:anti-sigma factor [Thiomonas intermedia]|uniref:anti-sigma factor n=1 Tax=Thiomonas intermedia TaxID=926 RepID=UPI0009A492B3|nr:anti-sigma factor [Thiomonas intermedia]
MSLPKRYLNADLLQRLAADWLTGGLSSAAQRRAQLLLEQSPAFAQAVRDWRERFDAALLSSPQLGRPSESVWQGITARLGAIPEMPQSAVSGAAGWGVHAWRRLSLLLGGVAVAAVAFSVVVLVQNPGQGSRAVAPVQMAALMHGEGGQAAVVTVQDSALTLTAVGAMTPPQGKSYQLWLLPTEGAPISLGVVAQGQTRYPLPEAARAHLTQAKAFAVSVEPPGGSPTGLPTGAVIMVGAAQRA